MRGLIDGIIIDSPDYPELFDEGDRLGFSGKRYREGGGKSRRDRAKLRNPPPPPSVNLSVNIPIHNNNQQEQEMSQDKQQHLHGDYVRGDKVMGDKDTVAGNKMRTGNVAGDAIAGNKIVTSQNLAEAAQEIQALIEQLATTYNTDSMMAKVAFAEEIKNQVEGDPSLGGRILSASKAGGIAAIEQFLNHPLASFVMAALEDWQKKQVK